MGWFREKFIGEGDRYDYLSMCKMTYPCAKTESKAKVNFYSKDEPIPYFLAMIMGLQHAFAMVGGLITPPLVIFRFTVCGFGPEACPDLEQYAISAALIVSGICSIVNVARVGIPYSDKIFGRKLFLGSGILSVMGTSFTFLPIFEIAIRQMKADDIDGEAAYGAMLGTSMVCCLLELMFSLLPVQYIKRVFPPLVTSITVILIGVALTGTGMRYFGGGVVCADMIWKEHSSLVNNTVLEEPGPSAICLSNGDVKLGYGSIEYIGLGFSVMVALVFIELFGSVFMKNCNVIIALLFGYFVAGVSSYQGNDYVLNTNIKNAEPITFLWVETFPLGFYGAAVVPLLIGYLVTTVETVGDLTAVHEVSNLSTENLAYRESIQGGLLADAMSSIFGGFATTMPNTTFSQNNGVIALTKCASRRAGIGCGCWLIFLGVFSKISGVITSIPDCVIGGMTIFLFANVLASGIALTQNLDLHSRRVKFIMALSLAIGVGVTVFPYAFQDQRDSPYTANFWRCEDCSATMKGVRNGVSIFLSTGYCVGTVFAMILNAILPEDAGVNYVDDDITHVTKKGEVNDTMEAQKVEQPSVEGEEVSEPEEVDA